MAPPKLSRSAIVVLAANTMNGPGLTTLPSMASAAGKVTFQIVVWIAALTTSYVVARLGSVMWSVHAESDEVELEHLLETQGMETTQDVSPGRETARPSLEETDIVALSERLFGLKKLASIIMVGCALSLALAQMMVCAAIADSMFVASVGKSCGLGFFPLNVYCTSNLSMKPFMNVLPQEQGQDDGAASIPVSVVSIGLVLASSITISLASIDLDSLLMVQYVLFGCLLAASARFCSTLYDMGSDAASTSIQDNQPVDSILPSHNQAAYWIGPQPLDAIGPTLFNFAFIVTAPPLIGGTDDPASSTRALVVACLLMGTLYVLVGVAGANAAASSEPGQDHNLLSLVLRGTHPEKLNRMDIGAVVLFGLSQLASIPVYCEMARTTLLTHIQIQNRQLAFAASNVWPWILVALTYNSALFEAFVEWSSLLLLGFANFSMPLLLDHVYTQRLLQTDQSKVHERHHTSCPTRVAWALALITGSISAVIVQRITGNVVLAEFVLLGSTMRILHWS